MNTETITHSGALSKWRNTIPDGSLVWYLRGGTCPIPLRTMRRHESVIGVSYECAELSMAGGGGIRWADELLPDNITEALSGVGLHVFSAPD